MLEGRGGMLEGRGGMLEGRVWHVERSSLCWWFVTSLHQMVGPILMQAGHGHGTLLRFPLLCVVTVQCSILTNVVG